MTVSRMCQECVGVVTGHCDGKEQGEAIPGRKPCKDYVFDVSMASEQDIEPDSKPPSLKDHKPEQAKPLIPGSVLPTNTAKAANFERLAVKRLSVLLDGFRKLSNLGNKAVYEWSQEQVDVMLSRIRGAADDLEKKFI